VICPTMLEPGLWIFGPGTNALAVTKQAAVVTKLLYHMLSDAQNNGYLTEGRSGATQT